MSGGQLTSPFTVDGSGVYMDQAYIRNIDASKINAGTINVALALNAATINAGTINSSGMSGGTITGTAIDITSGGHVRSGQTAYDTGTGFWLGDVSGTPKFSIGNSGGNKMTWDGTNLSITGALKGATLDHATSFLRDPNSSEGGQLFMQMPSGITGLWAMDVYSDGRLRFFIEGNENPPAGARFAEFDQLITVMAGGYDTYSTIRIKENVRTLKNSLTSIKKLRGVTYDRKDKSKLNDIGLIAEEVIEVFPQLVSKNEKNEVTSLQYSRIVAVLIEAVKELSAEVDELKRKING